MSLLLDALQRASKDKEKAAATAAAAVDAETLPTLAVPLEISPRPAAEAIAAKPLQISSAAEYPTLSVAQEQPPKVPPIALPEMELTLDMPLQATPPSPEPVPAAAPLPPEPRQEPKLDPLSAPEPRVDAVRHTVSPSPMPPAGEPVPPPAAAAAVPSDIKPVAVSADQAAQDIRRAYASQKPPPVSRGRRVLAWVVLAGLLALAVASVFLGLWGDPSSLIRLVRPSSIATVSPLPTTGPAELPPATLPSAPASATEAVAPLVPPSAPQSSEMPTPRMTSTPEPIPTKTGTRSRAATAPRNTDGQAPSSKPVFAAKAAEPSALEAGYAALIAGRFDEATQAYERSLKANPDERDALLGLAYIHHKLGRLDDARTFYRKVLRNDPSNANANSGLLALDMDGDATRTAGRARDLASRRPDSAAAMAAAGTAFVRDGLLADAATAFGRAQALEPSNPLHAYNHAVALDRLGQVEKAVVQYEKALSLPASAGAGAQSYQVDAVRLRIDQLRRALDKQNGLEE